MNKKSFSFLLALPFVFMACNDTNAPGKSENTSVPALVREITYANVSETQKILTDKGFVQSGDPANGIYVYYYPATVMSEDAKVQETAFQKEWVSLECRTDGGKYAQSIEGTHHLISASNAFNTFKQWMSYLQKNVSKPSLHYVMVVEGENIDVKAPFIYGEGTLYEHYREFMLAQIEAVYKQGIINAAEYEQEKAALCATKEELDQKIASLSLNKAFSIVDVYCELTDAYTYKGVLTTSMYSNETERADEAGIAQNTILMHTVLIGDVKDAIIDFIPSVE
ncbi:MAG: hypothetical protein J5902_05315 [Paludibacteraceae bacterium]|nr:hypothetical protein [Paludibacteraceae bacterium]